VGGSTSTSIGGGTTGGAGGGTGLTTIKLDDVSGDCDIIPHAPNDAGITPPTTWHKAVYDTSSCGVVYVSAALTIEAGAIIKFAPGGYIDVASSGTVTATGTASDPIVFTSMKDDAHGGDTNADGATAPTKGDWGCIGTCGDMSLLGNSSHLDHVQFLYGYNGLWVQAASVNVTNSVFAHNTAYGAVLDGRYAVQSTTLTGNTFFDNGGFPLSLGEFVSLDSSNIFHDPANAVTKNGKQCIEISATSLDAAVTLGVTELAFYTEYFAIDSALTVANNVCFKTAPSSEIDLDAAGSIINGANAIFTSAKDDAVAGDCTGDGATTPANGDWDGLWITASSTSDFAMPSSNIRYAGYSGLLPLH
jgi:hypothetical protein